MTLVTWLVSAGWDLNPSHHQLIALLVRSGVLGVQGGRRQEERAGLGPLTLLFLAPAAAKPRPEHST